ncbi:MAG: response regulator [Gracilimonas sp.]|nr:response regulator [Gracilimonas sp.]
MNTRLNSGKIIVVDDSPENLDILGSILRETGYDVFQFPSGKLAINAAKEISPDLILLDIMMPEMDGFKTHLLLSKIPVVKDVPIIYISAARNVHQKIKAFKQGAVDYITKPFQEAEILARVKTHIKLRKTQLKVSKHKEYLEAKVRDRTRELIEAQQVAKIGSWKYNINNGEINWSPATYDIFDIPAEQKISFDKVLSMIHPADKDFFLKNWRQFLTNKQLLDMQYRITTSKDKKWLEVKGKFSEQKKQEEPLLVGTVQDITKRKEAQIELEKSEVRFRTIFEQSSVIMSLVEQSSLRFIDVNPAFINFYGWKKKDIIGQKLDASILSNNTKTKLKTKLKKNNSFRKTTTNQLTKDNKHKIVDMYFSFIQYKKNNLIHIIHNDRTEKFNYSKQLKKKNKALKEATWNLSHSLRSPLTRMMVLLELMQEGEFNEISKEQNLNELIKSANEMDHLIRETIKEKIDSSNAFTG